MDLNDESVRQLLASLVLLAIVATVLTAVVWKLTQKRRERERTRLFLERGVRGTRRD